MIRDRILRKLRIIRRLGNSWGLLYIRGTIWESRGLGRSRYLYLRQVRAKKKIRLLIM